MEIWDKYIDIEENSDVDLREWIDGLQRLDDTISLEDSKKMFDLMDYDRSGYIDTQDWVSFLTQEFDSDELTRLQYVIMVKIKGQNYIDNLKKKQEMQKQKIIKQSNLAEISLFLFIYFFLFSFVFVFVFVFVCVCVVCM